MGLRRLPKVRVGDIVAVHFLDHCADGDEAMAFIVYGRVSKNTRTVYIIDSWAYEDVTAEVDLDNINQFTIVKRAVTSVDILVKSSN